MSIVTINLNNRDFKLICPKESHNALLSLAAKMDLELAKIKEQNPSASFDLLMVMLALDLFNEKQQKINLEGGEILKEAHEDFQDSLSSIFSELKVVAKKLEKC